MPERLELAWDAPGPQHEGDFCESGMLWGPSGAPGSSMHNIPSAAIGLSLFAHLDLWPHTMQFGRRCGTSRRMLRDKMCCWCAWPSFEQVLSARHTIYDGFL